jgi:hypothetical protein
MEIFCSGLADEHFNRPVGAWPVADVAHVDMGILGLGRLLGSTDPLPT